MDIQHIISLRSVRTGFRKIGWGAAVLIALSAVLRLSWITRTSLWFDEVYSLVIARSPLREFIPMDILIDANSFLFNFMLFGWLRLFGEHLIVLRFLLFILGLLALVLYALFCRDELGNNAFVPIVIGSASYFWIYHGTELRPYSLFLLISIVSYSLLLKICRGNYSPRLLLLYGAVLLCGLHTHLYFFISF